MVIEKKGCRENNKGGMTTSSLQITSYKSPVNHQPITIYNNFDTKKQSKYLSNKT